MSSEQSDPTTDTEVSDPLGDATFAKQENPYSTMLTIIGGGVAIALIILAVGVGMGGGGGDGGGDGSSAAPVAVTLEEFGIAGALQVAPGGSLAVTNVGSQVHNLVITGGTQTADLNSGESENLPVEVAAGEYEVFCSIPGHREAGMEAVLTVDNGAEVANTTEELAAEPAPPADGAIDHSSHATVTPEEAAALDAAMIESFQPFVDQLTSGKSNTEGVGGEDLEPTIAADGAEEFTLTAEIVEWEISPGEIVEAWTYNGTVPGPTLRAEVGDRIRVKYINDLPISTDVHMHGTKHPNNMDGVAPITQDAIPPGGEFTYEFDVTEPAIAMYHPHMHGQATIPDGMWAAMIFSPKGGGGMSDYTIPRGKTVSGVKIPEDLVVAQEHNMTLNDAGSIGLSLNGKSFPGTKPYSLEQGDYMLVNYYNEGLQYHPMHLHQFPQLVVARDGIPLDQPYYADTISVGPGERYTVLFQATTTGVWVWHCHILTHAESEEGMFGMVTAVAVS